MTPDTPPHEWGSVEIAQHVRRAEVRNWKPAETAPYGKIVLVQNSLMKKPVRATRGYVHNGAVHEDQPFFTTVFTSDEFCPTPSGRLVIPDEWAELDEDPQ